MKNGDKKSKSRTAEERKEKTVEKNTRQEKKHYDVELNIHFKWPQGKLLHFRRHRCSRQSFYVRFLRRYRRRRRDGGSRSTSATMFRLPNPTEIILLKWIRVWWVMAHTFCAYKFIHFTKIEFHFRLNYFEWRQAPIENRGWEQGAKKNDA